MKELTAYQCDYCKKLLRSELAIQKHEAKHCFYSPQTHSCATCKHCFASEVHGDIECELGLICDEWENEYIHQLSHPWKHCADWELVDVEVENLRPITTRSSIGVVRVEFINNNAVALYSKKRFEEYKNLIRKFAKEHKCIRN